MRRLPVWLLAGVFLGCNGGSGPSSTDGNYRLISLRGTPLPYTDVQGCCTYESGGLELREGDYTVNLRVHNDVNQQTSLAYEAGRYRRDGDSIRFNPLSANITWFLLGQATVVQDTVRLSLGGEGPGAPDAFPAVFVKE
jgi:hypothetical protein